MNVNWIEDSYGNMSCHDNSSSGSAEQSKLAEAMFKSDGWYVKILFSDGECESNYTRCVSNHAKNLAATLDDTEWLTKASLESMPESLEEEKETSKTKWVGPFKKRLYAMNFIINELEGYYNAR